MVWRAFKLDTTAEMAVCRDNDLERASSPLATLKIGVQRDGRGGGISSKGVFDMRRIIIPPCRVENGRLQKLCYIPVYQLV